MSDDGILALARRAYSELGVTPAASHWGRPPPLSLSQPLLACVLGAACITLEAAVLTHGAASQVLQRNWSWVRGCAQAFDGLAQHAPAHFDTALECKRYVDGYKFGQRARGEFLHDE